jgi:hypothetical protein
MHIKKYHVCKYFLSMETEIILCIPSNCIAVAIRSKCDITILTLHNQLCSQAPNQMSLWSRPVHSLYLLSELSYQIRSIFSHPLNP